MARRRASGPRLASAVLSIIFLLCTFPALPTKAQFIQDWEWRTDANGEDEAWWSPTVNAPLCRVWDFRPTIVFLEYNCFYMTAICQNAQQFINSARGQSRKWRTAFSYDFGGRTTKRREASCPSSWKGYHLCPEVARPGNLAQPTVMRQDGPWPYTALDPVQVPVNVIQHIRDSQGNVVSNSYLRYTCDEFPPATWVEGGKGTATSGEAAYTRCAAYRCPRTAGMKIYGEQNWQARVHTKLRSKLEDTAENCLLSWSRKTEPLMFWFRMTTRENNIPASVIVADAAGDEVRDGIPLSKRAELEKMSTQEFMAWADSVSINDLRDHGYKLTHHNVHVNDTLGSMEFPGGPVGFGHWSNDFEHTLLSDESDFDPEPLPRTLRRRTRTGFSRTAMPDQADLVSKISKIGPQEAPKYRRVIPAQNGYTDSTVAPLVKNATLSDIEAARKIVEDAIAESGDRNRARLAHMARNQYRLKPGTIVGGKGVVRRRRDIENREEEPLPLLFEVTPEIAAAAALVAEADADEAVDNLTTAPNRRVTADAAAAAAGAFWMETISRKGTVPWGDDPDYKVFRNVMDYGAKGDGKTDDTAAIKKAMNDGNRCGKNCNGSTLKNAVVYFPRGTYLVSSGIPVLYGTQLIGDANDWPTLMAAKTFIGTSVLSTDEYTGGGTGTDGLDQEWYVNTASFYRQIRNFRIDVTATRSAQEVACIHYQVAQATSLQFVELIAKPGTKQKGIVSENGSGGVLADITIKGGSFCLWGGNQQFTAQRLTFDGCSTAVQVIWDWGWVWKSITVRNADIGFRLLPEDDSGSSPGHIGSSSFIDSSFENVGTAVLIAPLDSKTGSGSTGVVLENVDISNVQKVVADTAGQTLLEAADHIDSWVAGPVYTPEREFYMGKETKYTRESSLLDDSGAYFERPKPQYEGNSVGDFVNLKDLGAKGDGVTDDTNAIQAAFNSHVGKIIFVDAGTYIITRTVVIPSGTKLVGETWSQFAAYGPFFSDASNPKVMLQVGSPGTVGDVEIQDLIFTTKGPTAGAVLVEWNIKASKPGSAGLWDCHVRIGGATGTSLNPEECPAVTSGINQDCQGASMMMHLTKYASGYFENMWLWVADHMIDDPLLDDANNTMVQTSVYVARGFLIESQEATWLYGTASEHAVYYQYNFHHARNIFAGMIQTESPYYQPTPKPPQPFEKFVGKMTGDPDYTCAGGDFDGCDSSWAVMMRGCRDIFIAGAGLYSWFSTYSQDCIDKHECQKVLMLLENNSGTIRVQHMITIGAKYSLVQDGVGVLAGDNLNVDSHPSWSQISVFDSTGNEISWIDPKIWEEDEPTVWCEPPCTLKIPPWTGATSTINYPVVTASGDGWTSKITREPITVTQWLFQAVTIGSNPTAAAELAARATDDEVLSSVWPTFTATPVWPALVFLGGDGKATTTRPTSPTHPPPPSSPGPTPPPSPPSGEWPTKAIVVRKGPPSPLVGACDFFDPECYLGGWDWDWGGPVFQNPHDSDEDPEEQNPEDENVFCPDPKSTTTSNPGPPTPVPTLKVGIPADNTRDCYDDGQWTSHVRMDNAVKSFCSNLLESGTLGPLAYREKISEFPYDLSELGYLKLITSVEVADGCEWKYNEDECNRYLHVPIDSCDCGGINHKRGGTVKNNCLTWRVDPNTKW
ncbi:hypothetical protein AAE478_005666 [Parahypoxylon ruwenzoriense]